MSQGESTLESPCDRIHNQVLCLLTFPPRPCLPSKSLQALGDRSMTGSVSEIQETSRPLGETATGRILFQGTFIFFE